MAIAEALLQGIAADPADDAPRLIYADWLDEHGQPERAEFIRVQIELARSCTDARYLALRRREMELLEDHQGAWSGDELPPGMTVEKHEVRYWPRSGFRRGFPARVAAPLPAFLSGGEHLAQLPTEQLHIDDVTRGARSARSVLSRVARLAACPALASFPRLNLQYGSRMGPAGLAILLGSPYLPWLQELVLGPDVLGEEGARSLAYCERLVHLRRLDIRACRINTSGLRALLVSPYLGALEDVDLGGNNLNDEAAFALAAHVPGSPWRTLDVGHNEIGRLGLSALCHSRALSQVETLNLSSLMPAPRTWHGNVLIEDLVRAGLPTMLRRLRLHANKLTAAGIPLLVQHEQVGPLVELDLAINPFGAAGARALAASPHLAALEELAIYSTGLDDAAAEALAASSSLKPRRLHLASNAIGPQGARALAESGFLARVTEINLTRNPLGDEGVAALTRASWLERLCELDLSGTQMGNAGLAALAASPALGGIVRLDLRGNRFSEKGAIALAESPHASRLRRLDLSRNKIGRKAVHAFRARFGGRFVSHQSAR
jgi:uncharacterized protein (TIGR02996 family)